MREQAETRHLACGRHHSDHRPAAPALLPPIRTLRQHAAALEQATSCWLSTRCDSSRRDRLRRSFMSSTISRSRRARTAVSAVHGHGTGDLLDACLRVFPAGRMRKRRTRTASRVAVIGKPNVGKSIACSTASSARSVLSSATSPARPATASTPMWTTRTASLSFIDTAGIRKKSQGGREDREILASCVR